MASNEHPHHLVRWPSFDLTSWWTPLAGRLADLEPEPGWLRVEEFHDDDTLVVRAEAPGVDPAKDIEVSVADGVVRIGVRREERKENTSKEGYRSELRYGSFTREVAVAPTVKGEDVTASYHDGILEVRIPCPAAGSAGVTTVPVTTG